MSLNFFYQNKTKAGEGTNLSNLSLIQYVSVNVDSSYLGDNPIGYGYEPDVFLLGKSVAKSMVLYAEEAGIARVDVLGEMNDKTNPFSHYWINAADDTDLGVASSTYNSRVAKTIITSNNFIINLVRGKNVICFKTKSFNPAGGNALISTNQKIGFKIRTKNKIFCNEKFFVKSDEKDLADLIYVDNRWTSGISASKFTSRVDASWGSYNITPKDADGNFVNNFPKIMSIGVNWDYYATKYPYLDFSNKGNPSMYAQHVENKNGNFLNLNTSFNFLKKYAILKMNNPIQIILSSSISNTSTQYNFYLSVYNSNDTDFSGTVGLDPNKGGWKFYGNPEMSINALQGQSANGQLVYSRIY